MTNLALIIIGVLLFELIIFIHEFGHFITAKWSGVWVKEFALGMGPKVFSFKKGDTVYSLRLLPIGGFCDMEGEQDESYSPTSFNSKPIYKRMIIVVTGAILNLILGVVLMATVLFPQELLATTTIAAFTEGSLLEEAGVQVGDTIIEVDGYKIYSEKDLSYAYSSADADSVDIVVERAGEVVEFNGLELVSVESDGYTMISIDFYVYGEEVTVLNVIEKSFVDSYSLLRMVVNTFIGMFTGEYGLNEVSGPVGATQAISQAASAGLNDGFGTAVSNIVTIMAVITINLGVFNLLPFPALDGGRFVFLIVELIRRKPAPAKVENMVNAAGFALLIGFMLVITFKDVYNLIF